MGDPSTGVAAKSATQILMEDNTRRAAYVAVRTLLLRLERWVRAVPRDDGVEMPDHIIQFTAGVDDGPGKVIRDAIKCSPALWADAIAEDVVIVPRKSLEALGVDRQTIDYLASVGETMVGTHAAKYRHALDGADRR